jgi:hypothetical protein
MDASKQPVPNLPAGGRQLRREHRTRVLKMARIIFNGGYSVYDCRVRNISDSGAMLEVTSMVGIPSRFQIAFDGTSPPRPCRIMWRTDRLMGVAFDDAIREAAVPQAKTSPSPPTALE